MYTCANCGDSYSEAIPATGHSYTATETAPTCVEDGSTVYTCANCGDSYSVAIPATGHDYVGGICTLCGSGYNSGEIKWQISAGATAADASTNLRLISFVDNLSDYSKVVFTVSFSDAKGNTYSTDLVCTTVYEQIVANGVSIGNAAGIFGEGAQYFVTYTINGWAQAFYDTDITVTLTRYDLEGNVASSATRIVTVSDAM